MTRGGIAKIRGGMNCREDEEVRRQQKYDYESVRRLRLRLVASLPEAACREANANERPRVRLRERSRESARPRSPCDRPREGEGYSSPS